MMKPLEWALTGAKSREIPDMMVPAKVMVTMLPSVRTDIERMMTLTIRKPMSTRMLKARISEIIMVPFDRLKIMMHEGEAEEKIDEELEVPSEVYVRDRWAEGKPDYHFIDVSEGVTGNSFVYRIDKRSNNDDVVCGLASILGVRPNEIRMCVLRRVPWFYPESFKNMSIVVACAQPRGGMRSPRSLSPTVPFVSEDPPCQDNVNQPEHTICSLSQEVMVKIHKHQEKVICKTVCHSRSA